MRERRHPRLVIRARPRGSCKAIHDAEFGVGDSYHVVRSERDIFIARGHLAGSGMVRLPAIEARPRGGPGPISAPNSGDDTLLRGGPPPHAAGPIKVGEGPSFSISVLLPPYKLDFVIASTPPPVVIAWTLPPVGIAWTPPSQPEFLLHADGRIAFSGRHFARVATKQEMTRHLSWGYHTMEHPPKRVGGAFGQACKGTKRP